MSVTSRKLSNPGLFESSHTQKLCQIVGFTCLIAFVVDLIVLLLPLNLGAPAWRIGVLQQIGDRSIMVFFGLALSIYGAERRRFARILTVVCFTIGISFLLSCAVVAQDSLVLQRQSNEQISNQAAQLNSQLQMIEKNAKLAPKISKEQLGQAAQRVSVQAETAKQNTSSNILRSGFLSVGNLAVIGLALLVLGRYGLLMSR